MRRTITTVAVCAALATTASACGSSKHHHGLPSKAQACAKAKRVQSAAARYVSRARHQRLPRSQVQRAARDLNRATRIRRTLGC